MMNFGGITTNYTEGVSNAIEMRHLDLFSGIGGFALAVSAVWPGAEHVFCEIDPFCQAVLKKTLA